MEHITHVKDQSVQVHYRWQYDLFTCVGQQLRGKGRSAISRLLYIMKIRMAYIIKRQPLSDKLGIFSVGAGFSSACAAMVKGVAAKKAHCNSARNTNR